MRNYQLMFAALVLGLMAIYDGQAAYAQGIPCGPTELLEKQLSEKYGEALRDQREADVPGGTVYLWANRDTGRYSILTNPMPGITCLIDAGQSDMLKDKEV